MDSTSLEISGLYDATFSPKFREGIKAMTLTDLMAVIVLSIILVYILAKIFGSPCQRLCGCREDFDIDMRKFIKIIHMFNGCKGGSADVTLVLTDETDMKVEIKYIDDNKSSENNVVKFHARDENGIMKPTPLKIQKVESVKWEVDNYDMTIKYIGDPCPIVKIDVELIDGSIESVNASSLGDIRTIDQKYITIDNNNKYIKAVGMRLA